MNKRERVIAAFQGKEVDHVPVCMWKHVPEELWANDDDFIACQLNSYKVTDVDFVKLSADKYFNWPSPVLQNIETADELFKIERIGADHPWIRGQIERTKKIVQGINGECVVLYLIFAPICYLRLQIGYDKTMELIRQNPEAMKYALSVIKEDVKDLVKGIITESGADGIMFSVQNGEIDRFTEEEYRNWLTPSEKEVLEYANTLTELNAIHLCGWEGTPNRLSVWKDYPANAVSWARFIDMEDIKEAKEYFGRTVWGGFDNRSNTFLYTATKEEIEAEVANLVAQGGKTGYMIGSDCSLHDELDEERIRWVVEAARKI
ncbi:MAG: hypothetical protein J6D00_05540 [Christensenellaceae bacterium]|nr:hypothetical protein [Christensenellaceae bacterium]MBR3841751.1 hypothetical protein [Christensenellaceae bacterium]